MPAPRTVPRLVVNKEETPPVALPGSIGFRGFNSRGHVFPDHELSEEGHALREALGLASNNYLALHGCDVVGRFCASGNSIKAAFATVEHEALAANYRGIIKLVADTHGVQLQGKSVCFPSLKDGMVLGTDAVLLNWASGTGARIITTIDYLCVNPKTCFDAPGSIYAQMRKKEESLLREGPSKAQRRLDDLYALETARYEKDPERYSDALTNLDALDALSDSLVEGLDQALHVVALDPVCDQRTLDSLISYLKGRASEEGVATELPVTKFVGTARAPAGASLEEINSAMVEGHHRLFRPTGAAEAIAPCSDVPEE